MAFEFRQSDVKYIKKFFEDLLVETNFFKEKWEQMQRKEWDGSVEYLKEILLEEYLLDLENLY